MKLSELSKLVAYRNLLDKIDIDLNKKTSILKINSIMHTIESSALQIEDYTEELQSSRNNIMHTVNEFYQNLDNLKNKLNELILLQEPAYLKNCIELYRSSLYNETSEYILNRKFALSNETVNLFKTRISSYTDFKFPGLIIRPGNEEWLGILVANDPLYIVDLNKELLIPCLENYRLAYKQRIRSYVVIENSENKILNALPDSQFGLCFVYNFFNFKPLVIIKQYLEEIYQKLRPGGTLIMTYNDCDHEHGVILAERCFASYTPGRTIHEIIKNIGYSITYNWSSKSALNWVELKKPGTLSSLRGGQALAKIIQL